MLFPQFGDLITADHQYLNVEDESRCDTTELSNAIGDTVVKTKISYSFAAAGNNLTVTLRKHRESLSVSWANQLKSRLRPGPKPSSQRRGGFPTPATTPTKRATRMKHSTLTRAGTRSNSSTGRPAVCDSGNARAMAANISGLRSTGSRTGTCRFQRA